MTAATPSDGSAGTSTEAAPARRKSAADARIDPRRVADMLGLKQDERVQPRGRPSGPAPASGRSALAHGAVLLSRQWPQSATLTSAHRCGHARRTIFCSTACLQNALLRGAPGRATTFLRPSPLCNRAELVLHWPKFSPAARPPDTVFEHAAQKLISSSPPARRSRSRRRRSPRPTRRATAARCAS